MHRSRSVALALIAGALMISSVAQARTMEPGTLIIGGAVGPAFRLGSDLGMSKDYLMLNGTAEYTFSKEWSVIGAAAMGLANTIPFQLRAGGRYRIIGGEMPISPYVQAELTVGRLFDVLGANLTSTGARFGGGADYFLTASWMVGLQGACSWQTTLGNRPAGYSMLDLLITFGHVF
jgi:hypothetical protein